MLNEAEAVWATLSTLLGMRVRTNRSPTDVAMSVSLVTTAAAASQHRSTTFNKIERSSKPRP